MEEERDATHERTRRRIERRRGAVRRGAASEQSRNKNRPDTNIGMRISTTYYQQSGRSEKAQSQEET